MRFTANGLPDPTFNGGSPVLIPSGTSGWQLGYAVTLQPVTVNGQTQMDIVVAGDIGIANTSSGIPTGFLVARFNPDGTPDTTFNNGTGFISIVPQPGEWRGTARGVAIDSSGNIVVGGDWQSGDGSTYGIAVARLHPDGTLDTTFGSGGVKSEVAGPTSAEANGLAIGTDGNYYLAGYVQDSTGSYTYKTMLAYFSP